MSDAAVKQGDIFWDLQPSISYTPGMEFGCTLYVANPTAEDKDYALMARLSKEAAIISEASVRVFGTAWFQVEAGDWTRLHGAFAFEETDVTLTVLLCERETGEVVDSVSVALVSPSMASLPSWPNWPGGGETVVTASDPNSLMTMLEMIIMTAMLGMMFKQPAEAKAKAGEE